MKILTEFHNSLLHRKDVVLMKEFKSNPGVVVAKQEKGNYSINEHSWEIQTDRKIILADPRMFTPQAVLDEILSNART